MKIALQFRFPFFLMLLMVTLSSSGQSSIGRLFTSPIERQRIDIGKKRANTQSAFIESARPTAIVDQAVVDGYVVRSSGKTTTWINDVALDEISRGKSIQVTQRPGQTPTVSIQTDRGNRINVDVGDMLDIHTGAVRKVYESPAEPPSLVKLEKSK